MRKKILSILLAMLVLCGVMAGCNQGTTTYTSVWFSEADDPEGNDEQGNNADEGDKDPNNASGDGTGNQEGNGEGGKDTSKTSVTTKRTKKPSGDKTTVPTGSGQTRPTRKETEMLTFKPLEDKGANYNVKGTVRIAVDTVRPTDFEAMFDIMEQLYPGVTVEYDYWTHSSNDDGREYLIKNSSTGSMADIMWDEAGEMPVYIRQGWVYPITEYVNKDPEAANIPASVKKDYTFFGELYAVPHQATVEIVAFNADLMKALNIKKPGLEWTMDQYEDLLRAGAAGFNQKLCVGTYRLFEAYHRYSYYAANVSSKGANYGVDGYNYATKKIDTQYLAAGAEKFRYWRTMTPGTEAYYEATFNKDSTGKSKLSAQLGINDYLSTWAAGKALIYDCITWQIGPSATKNWGFDWYAWPMPNQDGNMPVHIDQCFITSTCKDENIDAAFQLLRFMTYTTNGNLARLTMYEDSQADKYTLNSYIYYPVTTSKKVLEKFESLSCTGEVENYILKNIPNSSRYDNYKLVPQWREAQSKFGPTTSDITDGLKDGTALAEPVSKANDLLAQAWKDFESETKKVQAEFNKKHNR